MGYKGGPKTGGRRPGTPNKRQSVLELCLQHGLDPFEGMIKIAKDETNSRAFDALKELCQYIEPKKKALEHSGQIDTRLLEAAEEIEALDNAQKIERLKDAIDQLEQE